MNKSLFRPLLCCALALLSLVCVAEATVGKKASLADLASKQHLSGAKCSANDLKGKVIFFEYWGINCPPCLAAMPHLQEMYAKYKSRGFVVIGSHCQFPSPQVQEYLKEKKITFPIYQFAGVPEAPCPGGLPYSVLIGADGRIVAEGRPSELYDKVEEELAKAEKGVPILEGVELKKYKSLTKSVTTKSSNVEAKIAPLRSKTDDEEAQAVCEAYDNWLAEEKTRVENLCQNNPLMAMSAIRKLKVLVPSVTDFDEQLATFKNNADLQKVAELGKKVQSLKKMAEKGRKIHPASVKKLQGQLEGIQQATEDGSTQAAADILLQELKDLAPKEEA